MMEQEIKDIAKLAKTKLKVSQELNSQELDSRINLEESADDQEKEAKVRKELARKLLEYLKPWVKAELSDSMNDSSSEDSYE